MTLTAETPDLIGSSRAIAEVRAQITAAARLDEPVLITGETGVGKELVATAIHANSHRRAHPLQVINCAGVGTDLLASELFGHRAGSFTGARGDRAGRLLAAQGSTVVLDEITETPQRFQTTLLRTIETGEIQPVGSDSVTHVDARFIATTNRPLADLVRGENFRADLFYRLAGLVITVAPLRDRMDDVPQLAGHFLAQLEQRYGTQRTLSEGALRLLLHHSYPGNVRELRQVLTRAYAASESRSIAPEQLLGAILLPAAVPAGSSAEMMSLESVIRSHIQHALAMADDNISQAARSLEIPRSTLQHYLAKYGIAASPARRPRRRATAP